MEQNQELHGCLVIWRGQKFTVQMNPLASLKELGDELQKRTNVKTDTLRLIVPMGKSSTMLYPFSDQHSCLSLEEASVLKGKPIRMMGVLEDEVDEVLQKAKVDLRIAGFDEEERRLRLKILNGSHTSRKLPQGNYIFCDFQTLSIPGVELNPPASQALELLHMLASDTGIVAIMNKHRWRVGILTEMAPIGYVGVSPKCILGLNKNCGEEISLRLRTDDLKGFRKYDSIKKTLLHELAHMVYSEHDADFYALDKQLNKEATSLDWTKSRGHTLSGFTHSLHYSEGVDAISNVTASRKLGGQPSILPNPRSSSVSAAYQRLADTSTAVLRPETTSKPDVDVDSNDAFKPYGDLGESHSHSDVHMNPDIDLENELDDTEADSSPKLLMKPDGTDYFTNSSMDIPSHVNTALAAPAEPEQIDSQEVMLTEPVSSEVSSASVVVQSDPDDPELQIIQDPVTLFCGRLQNAVMFLKNDAHPLEFGMTLKTLIKIISNLLEHPNELKFRKLRKANPMIQKNIVRYKAAMDILILIGFSEDAIVDDDDGKVEIFLVLKRNDPGLLWLAKSSLETYVV